jgi:hypothetical protein
MRKMRGPGVQIKTPAQLAVMWEAAQLAVMWEAGQVVAAAGQPMPAAGQPMPAAGQPMPADLTEGGFVIRAAEPCPAGWGGGAGYAQ